MVDKKGLNSEKLLYCLFCGKSQYEVKKFIVGLLVFICDECIDFCNEIICDEVVVVGVEVSLFWLDLLSLQEICDIFDQYVIGQECVKKIFVVVVYNYYKCLKYFDKKDDVELLKSNILLIGLMGFGKMLFVQMFVWLFNVLFVIVDVMMLIEVGYVGEDVENIIQKLLQNCNYEVDKVQCGIVYIDEIDKISCKLDNLLIMCDVLGEGVQQVLLKFVEGMMVLVLLQGGCKYLNQDFIQVDMINILFICGGVFDGFEKVIIDCIEKIGIGFGVMVKSKQECDVGEVLCEMELEDLIKFGLIFELIGCLLVVVMFGKLDEVVLMKILVELKNVFVKQYYKLFVMECVELEIWLGVLQVVVCKVICCKIGVCGLCLIIEQVLFDVMYELLMMKGVSKVIIDENVIDGGGKFLLIYEDMLKVVGLN